MTIDEQNTQTLLTFLQAKKNTGELVAYKKFAQVLARPAVVGEVVQTKINEKNETSERVAVSGEWVVLNKEAYGEKQITPDAIFRKRYDVDNPLGYDGDGYYLYQPKNAMFYGVRYTGPEIVFCPPNWGGSLMTIAPGYMLGCTNPDTLEKDFYGIEPGAFEKTYK